MVDVYKTVARAAATKSTVLILGESGTGKELMARALHQHSPRSHRPFVAVDCGAMTESLLESELFGHVRGAFTGAFSDKRGVFEEADTGTCFLDEIGDITPNMQAKLLRVLQENEIRRVGGQKWIKVDVRILAATNRDLVERVKQGTFRQDLFYRINVVTIHLPALRQRAEDIPALAYHFLRRYSQEHGKPVVGISEDAMALLRAYTWPGNIRELENTIERAVALSNQAMLTPEDLPVEVRDRSTPRAISGRAIGSLERLSTTCLPWRKSRSAISCTFWTPLRAISRVRLRFWRSTVARCIACSNATSVAPVRHA